ncbi:hypothetical protein FQN54_001631 [Arachnomyces sp. PD_36]|nr:hypothetical protein FQN54_001631 [Arachnomyces sp. PD_36]
MTRMRGGSVSPPDPTRSPVDSERPPFNGSKLPSKAPDIVAKNTISVSDPSRVLPWHKSERQREFNLLVRRYINQLLYGCQDPNCTTPTCFSYRRRVTDGPLRKLTELSARTVACYLASQDNPENGLCRNEPAIPSDFHTPGDSRKTNKRSPQARSPDVKVVSDSASLTSMTEQRENGHNRESFSPSYEGRGSHNRSTPSEFADILSPPSSGEKQPEATGGKRAQNMKDPKSFTQNLFDTLSLRMVEWLPLRRSPGDFDSSSNGMRTRSRQSPTDNSFSSDSQTPSARRRRPSNHRLNHPNGAPQSKTQHPQASNTGAPPALELKLPGPPVKRLSLGELEPKRQTSRTSLEEKTRPDRGPVRKLSLNTHPSGNNAPKGLSSPALKHRGQKNRHPNGDINSTRQYEQKKHRRVSWDGSKALRQSQRKEMRESQLPALETPQQQPQPYDSYRKPIVPEPKESENNVQLAQSLSHLSKDIINGLGEMMFETDEDVEQWKDEMVAAETLGKSELCDCNFSSPTQRQAFAFISQSMFYVLSSPDQLLQSFRGGQIETAEGRPLSSTLPLDLEHLDESFRNLYLLSPWPATMHNLWIGLERLFIPPPELSPSMRQRRRGSRSKSSDLSSNPNAQTDVSTAGYIPDEEAAHILTITLFALISSIPRLKPKTWQTIRQIRASGTALPDADIRKQSHATAKLFIDVTDKFEHDLSLRLVNRLVRAIAARLAFHEISKARSLRIQDPEKQGTSTMDLVLENLRRYHAVSETNSHHAVNFSDPHGAPSAAALAVEWLRTLLLKEWDGRPETTRSGPVGGAVQILASMYKDRARLGLLPEDFHTSFLSERLDPMETPVEWLESIPNNKSLHLLSYSFLFPPSALVTYFRALNYATMSKSYESAMTASRHVTQTAFSQTIPVYDDVSLLARLKTSMSTYLVLSVRREAVVSDALDQLWRREKRELMRPLKVQMGMQEGEEGIDHGGVQQEFFRVVIAEVLDPAFGLFTTDPRTRISWFQPCSLEPLYKFELLGLLTSLAIYNGLTLPVNFPIALYRKLLGLKVKKIDHIRVGWEDLAKGLDELLSWDDGDVGDIFMRTYEFGFEVFGSRVEVNMESVGRDDEWPVQERDPILERRQSTSSTSQRASGASMLRNNSNSILPDGRSPTLSGILKGVESRAKKAPVITAPVEEASLVTNENRQQFVKDYIFWLTDKSVRNQYEAFARGFYTCLDRTALSIFTPEALKAVVEGIQEFDIGELENHARYDGGFEPTQKIIKDFWDVVRQFPQEKKAQLLEFVTASDRVPVNGIESIMFVIQKNGVGDDRLPTSLTCFGRLLLPEYSSRDILEEKLCKALENAQGFGVA